MACVLWIDSLHAKIFRITPEGVSKKSLKLNKIQHHTNHYEKNLQNSEDKFFAEVVEALGDISERFLIMGAGPAKIFFKSYLEKHRCSHLLKALVDVVTIDSVSDNQILEASRTHFKKFDMFHAGI